MAARRAVPVGSNPTLINAAQHRYRRIVSGYALQPSAGRRKRAGTGAYLIPRFTALCAVEAIPRHTA